MSDIEKQRDKLFSSYTKSLTATEKAKREYDAFCRENPLQPIKQPTIHELRMMRQKVGEVSNIEHAKVNKLHGDANKMKQAVESAKAG
ncbi:MAG: hypothetical protein ACPG47_12110 [Leucothrix sp.]